MNAIDPLNRLVAEHQKLLAENPHAYFEISYTRVTDWMAWICDKVPDAATGKPEPGRTIIAVGQGQPPQEAARAALVFLSIPND